MPPTGFLVSVVQLVAKAFSTRPPVFAYETTFTLLRFAQYSKSGRFGADSTLLDEWTGFLTAWLGLQVLSWEGSCIYRRFLHDLFTSPICALAGFHVSFDPFEPKGTVGISRSQGIKRERLFLICLFCFLHCVWCFLFLICTKSINSSVTEHSAPRGMRCGLKSLKMQQRK